MPDTRQEDPDGFTVLELCIVIGVLVVLLGLGATSITALRHRAADAAAQAAARNAVVTQQAYFADRGQFGAANEVQPVEKKVEFADLGSRGAQVLGKVYVKVGPNRDVATLVSRSSTGTCYWVRQSATGATTYAKASCDVTPTDRDFHTSW